MNQVKCPDCGETYSEDMQSCPNCGCPNDNWKPKQEEQTQEPITTGDEEDFNENGQYSPISPSSWLFTDPWPLRNYPRKAFEKEHPFSGWLFGPWYLTCKNESEKEEYAVINNIFYFFNLIFKTFLYATLWAFFKGIVVLVAYLMFVLIFTLMGFGMANNNSTGGLIVLGGFTVIMFYAILIYFIVLDCCGMGKALHRYWPSIHRTWRRINNRYWNAMKK